MVSIAEYSQDPKYTIKVLSERTGVRPVTLRAWERRYDLLDPNRQDNNYRLYSERDIQIIRWITHRLDEGLSISNAVREYRGLRERAFGRKRCPLSWRPSPPRHRASPPAPTPISSTKR
jgi:MerR family transcriptional regulator, light-induced transcriptional regulator